MKKLIRTLCVVISLNAVAFAADMQKLVDRINVAHAVLHELMDTPDKGIPDDIAAKATCVAVIPSLKKGAFVVGGIMDKGC